MWALPFDIYKYALTTHQIARYQTRTNTGRSPLLVGLFSLTPLTLLPPPRLLSLLPPPGPTIARLAFLGVLMRFASVLTPLLWVTQLCEKLYTGDATV